MTEAIKTHSSKQRDSSLVAAYGGLALITSMAIPFFTSVFSQQNYSSVSNVMNLPVGLATLAFGLAAHGSQYAYAKATKTNFSSEKAFTKSATIAFAAACVTGVIYSKDISNRVSEYHTTNMLDYNFVDGNSKEMFCKHGSGIDVTKQGDHKILVYCKP